MSPTRTRNWAGPLLLLLITIGFYWKLTLTNQYTWLESPDFANQVLPWFQFQAGEWHKGRFPLWDPYEWGGQPLVGQAQPGAVYPPNWILFLLPLRNGYIRQVYLHWYYVLIHYMGALFCYWLCRDLRRSVPASVLAASAFALGGWLASTEWPQMMNGAVWVPLVFLFFLRMMRGELPFASAAFSGACLGMAFLAGHHQIPIFATLIVGGAWIYYLLQNRLDWTAVAARAVVFGLFVFLVGAIQILPAYEYGRESVRWVGSANPVGWKEPVPYLVHSEYSSSPAWILGVILPGVFIHADPFIGVVVTAMALVALALGWAERTVRIFGAIALAGWLLAIGQHSIFHGILYALVPMVEKARNPSMAVFIFHFGICVLSAFGVDFFSDHSWVRRGLAALAGLSLFVYGFVLVCWMLRLPVDPSFFGMTAFAGLLLAAVLYAWLSSAIASRHAVWLVILLMLLEIGNVRGQWAHREQVDSLLKKLARDGDVVQFLRTLAGPLRLETDDKELPYNFGDFHGIDVFGGYLASLTKNVDAVQGNYETRMLFGANYAVSPKPLRDGQVEVFSSGTGVKVYRNPEAFPRVWSVHEIFAIGSADQTSQNLQKPLEELRRRAFVLGQAPKVETCRGEDESRLVAREINRVVIEAALGCRGMVVLGETFFPGWKAWVDGRPAHIFAAYGVLRGVVVDGGRHHIEMRYRPLSFYLGAVLTGIGWLGTAVFALAKRRARV